MTDTESRAPRGGPIGIRRHFTGGEHVFRMVEWATRDARIINHATGEVAWEQLGVEFPVDWSDDAVNIAASKYFRGHDEDREWSLKQMVHRIVDRITREGRAAGYFADEGEADTFYAELAYLLITQRAAFNSPVWFNIGVEGVPQQASACFILSVDDSLDSILNWVADEGRIFRGGSGAGVNLSSIRADGERLGSTGTASGPVSFMRGADASAGAIKSAGKTRRAAKMVILNADHPDIEEFVWCKVLEERKARVLRDAGFRMGIDGADAHSVQYQNANNSVRVTDDFMAAVHDDESWELRSVTTGEVVKTMRARDLMRQIAKAAWECADPGIQFDTTINRWHTTPNAGRINASNPCSEYMHIDNSACNLASINLLRYLDDDGVFDVEGFRATVSTLIVAMDILVGFADYPTEQIANNARRFRQLGLGYANLGALLMARGQAYDSDAGRETAAAITALMTGQAYLTSATIAMRLGAFDGYADDSYAMINTLHRHRAAVNRIKRAAGSFPLLDHDDLVSTWEQAIVMAREFGVRNAQATVLAPTGTIGLMMGCDTTGIEPAIALSATKTLVGGGTMRIVNGTVPRALRALGYEGYSFDALMEHIRSTGNVVDAPVRLPPAAVEVFATAIGDNPISPAGHVRMMAAVQPFISGAISKTVNLPNDATVEDVEGIFMMAWEEGVKALAIYRDGCKVGQPLTATTTKEASVQPAPTIDAVAEPRRERLPRQRWSRTFDVRIDDCKMFVTVAEYEDGRPGELFIRVAKQGSTLGGVMDAYAIALSQALQHGAPLETLVSSFIGMRFEPSGITDDPEIRLTTSLVDYLVRRLALIYLPRSQREALGILTTSERSTGEAAPVASTPTEPAARRSGDAPMCLQCGVSMQRAGSCHACPSCGTTSGCS